MEIQQIQYDLKRDIATVSLHASGGTFANAQFPLQTGGQLSEAALEEKIKEKAKEIFQAAIAAL